MHKRLSKSLAILGVSLFASTTVLTTINSTQRYVAHADTTQSEFYSHWDKEVSAFQYGLESKKMDAEQLSKMDQDGVLNYYKAGQAALVGTFVGLSHANIDTSQYDQNYVNIAKQASQQAYTDYYNKVIQANGRYSTDIGTRIPLNPYNKGEQRPSNGNVPNVSPEDFINNFAYVRTQKVVDQNSHVRQTQNDDYFYGFDAKITNNTNAGAKYNYNPTSLEMNIPYDDFLDGQRGFNLSNQAINDAKSNTFTPKYIEQAAYTEAYVGYLAGKNGDTSIDAQAFYSRYETSAPFKYAYHIGNNTPLRTITTVDSNGEPQSVSKYSTFYSKDGLISNESYSQSSNNHLPSTPTAQATVVSPVSTDNPKPVTKHVVRKKVTKKHVRKVARKSHGLFTIKVKANKIYAYKSTNFKNHKSRKVEHKGTKLRVYGIVRKGHKTFYRVYGHRLITTNRHYVTKIK